MMADINHNEIDDEDAGEENASGVGLNTALPPDPQRASGAFTAGPELGDKNAAGEQRPENEKKAQPYADREAQTDVNTDPHHHPLILPKSGKEQP
jgi:hypothetical protein